MDVLAELGDINYLAVVVAAVVGFGIGAVWYSPLLFAKPWMRMTGRTEESAQSANTGLIFGAGFVSTLIGVFALALFVGPSAGLGIGAFAGLVAGVGIASMAVVINGLFEDKPPALMAINCGYQIAVYTAAGAILGMW